jgi:hypothetical protein
MPTDRSVRSVHFRFTTIYPFWRSMSKLLRGVAAGYGAKKLGGGCFSTVLVYILLWWLLGHFRIFQ